MGKRLMLWLALIAIVTGINACETKFEGFGVFLGSNDHFARSPDGVEEKVIDALYNDLGLRLYRTSYEQSFSPEPNKYEIVCSEESPFTCSWIKIHRYISAKPGIKIFASIWSPPHYMKKDYQLIRENEEAYYFFLKNITELIKTQFNIEIEKVSPINEPENFVAPWDHTDMTPQQLCRFVNTFKDPHISICPENAWFWVSRIYHNFSGVNYNCSNYCEVFATHAYALNLIPGTPDQTLAYYDLTKYTNRGTTGPIWVTEISSTFSNADKNQMKEAIDFAQNIINFVGTTCIQRYYFWSSYTLGYSGESLIWGNADGTLTFPKKYFVYKSFANASSGEDGVSVELCGEEEGFSCIQFGDKTQILLNKREARIELGMGRCQQLCCTTEHNDYDCEQDVNRLPALSICHCILNEEEEPNSAGQIAFAPFLLLLLILLK